MSDVAEHLANVVRIPTVSRLTNRPLADYAAAVLNRAHWQTQPLPYTDACGTEKINLIAAPPGENLDSPAANLAFFCHTDTVPYAPEWTAATNPILRDGLLHGCGSADVKGFLACLLTAASSIPVHDLLPGLRLVFTADEEIGCIGAKHLLAANAIRPRRAIVGEPTSLRPARAGKGYCLAEVTVLGQEAHSALPQHGVSAIYRAARLIAAIEAFSRELESQHHPLFDPPFTTLNIGTIQGGTAKNIIPGQCRFQLEWRPIPGQPANTVPAAISAIAANLRRADPGFQCELNIVRQQGGFETPANAALITNLESLSQRPATSIAFASEASLLAEIAEEVVVFGPGNMQTAHSSRECVLVAELEETVNLLRTLMTTCQL